MLILEPQVVALIIFLPVHFCFRIPVPMSCHCPGGLLETPPCWHATIYKGLHHVVKISLGTPVGGLKHLCKVRYSILSGLFFSLSGQWVQEQLEGSSVYTIQLG